MHKGKSLAHIRPDFIYIFIYVCVCVCASPLCCSTSQTCRKQAKQAAECHPEIPQQCLPMGAQLNASPLPLSGPCFTLLLT